MPDYWPDRRDLPYYRTALTFAERWCPAGGALVDIGGGVSLGCRYLTWFDRFAPRVSVELGRPAQPLTGVLVQTCDFLAWTPDRRYDLALCLQTLEHVPDAAAFAAKLLTLAPVLIVSVPYRWPAGRCRYHVHDPVDEAKLRSWLGRDPQESALAGDRLVCVYASRQ